MIGLHGSDSSSISRGGLHVDQGSDQGLIGSAKKICMDLHPIAVKAGTAARRL